MKQGQVLFEIDPGHSRPRWSRPRALLARDRAQAANAGGGGRSGTATLAEKEYVTAQQYEQARTDAAAADGDAWPASQAAVEQARLNLQYATIRAPIAGRTGSLLVREGNLVRGQPTRARW